MKPHLTLQAPEPPSMLSQALADSVRGTVSVKKYQAEMARRVAEVAEEVGDAARQRGMSDTFAEQLVQKVLGIVA